MINGTPEKPAVFDPELQVGNSQTNESFHEQ